MSGYSLIFILQLFRRILHGEQFRRTTPEERREYSAAVTLVGLGGLILLSLNAGAWALSPVFLWTCVVLVLFPLVAFSFWVQEHIAVVWSLSVGVLIPVAVFAYAIFRPAGSVPACAVARAGLILNAVLLVAGSVIRKT